MIDRWFNRYQIWAPSAIYPKCILTINLSVTWGTYAALVY